MWHGPRGLPGTHGWVVVRYTQGQVVAGQGGGRGAIQGHLTASHIIKDLLSIQEPSPWTLS